MAKKYWWDQVGSLVKLILKEIFGGKEGKK
jgi:hypothetical protein